MPISSIFFLMLRGFNGGCKDQHARLLLEESITLRLWLDHLGRNCRRASTLSENLNAVSNQTLVYSRDALGELPHLWATRAAAVTLKARGS
jgi:hypothetical protein